MIHTFNLPKYYTVQIDDDTGQVKIVSDSAHAKGRELASYSNADGYLRFKLNNKHVMIHHIVASFFYGPRPEGLVVNHKDSNRQNNRPDNLEYVTQTENVHHSVEFGMHVSNDPRRHGKYIDGRSSNLPLYKASWYQQNRTRLLAKASDRYQRKISQLQGDGSFLIAKLRPI